MLNLNFKELVNESKLACIITDKSGIIKYSNKKADQILEILKISKSDQIIKNFSEKFSNFDLNQLLNKPDILSFKNKDNLNYHYEITVSIKELNQESHYIFEINDISIYKNKIIESEIYKTIFNSVASAIVVTDLNGTIENVNPFFEKLTGYSIDEAIGQNPKILNSGYHSNQFFKEMWQTLDSGKIWRGNLHDKLKSGDLIWEKSVISPIKDEKGKIVKYVAIKENITKQIQQEEALKTFSYQDYLTGLYNRRKFMDYTEKLINNAKKNNIYLFCLMIDIDNFKFVNDTYGHEVGDQVLVALADVLKLNVRTRDIASRFGGEEFIVVLSKYSYEQALQRANKIRIDIANSKVTTNQTTISVTVSIGFVQYDNHSSINDWIKQADDALYQAKKTGKNKVCEYKNSITSNKN